MIQLFTDTSANLPCELVNKYGISVIPFTYTMDGVEHIPDTDKFDGKAYYDAIRGGSDVKTSMINVACFGEYFGKALEKGDDVLYIGMSGGISGTAHAAQLAVRELSESYPDRKIIAVDTLGASLGEGMLALEAAEKILEGMDISEIAAHVRRLIPHMCQCFTVDDLRYLKKNGRISGAASLIGNMLGIRPLLIGNNEGKIILKEKVRGAKKVLDAMANRYAELVLDKMQDIGIAHADNEAGKAYLVQRLRDKGFTGKCLSVCYEPVTGSHVGPGAVALFFFGTDRMA